MSPFDTLEQLELTSELSFLGACRFPGRLYDLGDYPALMPALGAGDWVSGELFSLTGPHVLQVLDDFEDCQPDNEEASLYLRRLLVPAGHDEAAWVYLYNKPVVESKYIVSGNWLDYLAKKRS